MILLGSISCLFGQDKSIVDYVDTKIGVTGKSTSNCVIGPQLPFGAINPSPNTSLIYDNEDVIKDNSKKSYLPKITTAGCDPVMPIMGFSQLHVSGTGGDSHYGHFLISPQIGISVKYNSHNSLGDFSETKAYYFKTKLLKYNIVSEIAPTKHAAIYRFTFPKADVASIVVDAAQSLPKDIMSGYKNYKNLKCFIYKNTIEIDKEKQTIRGMITTKGGWGCSKPYEFYFVAQFNKKVFNIGVWKDSTLFENLQTISRDTKDSLATQRIGAFSSFKTAVGEQVLMKVAISLSSYENAEKYLLNEIPKWDFETIKAAAKAEWDGQLKKITVTGVSDVQKKIFYTAMYHSMVMPRDLTGDNPNWKSNQPYWNDHYCVWDTWRTIFPLHALINPNMVRDNILAFLDRYKHNGMVRDGYISTADVDGDQGGNNIDNVIVEAYLKGIKGVDWNEAYQLLKYNAEYERGVYVPNKKYAHSFYVKNGWIPYNVGRASSKTLEFSYNDFCIASMAKGLGKVEDFNKYIERSGNWQKLWNDNTESKGYKGFIGIKDSNNTFIENDPAAFAKPIWTGPFYEGTSWHYSYFVPHDIDKLVSLMGGKSKFAERLDFALKNDLIDFGNEPSFLTLRLFNYANRPDLSSYWINYALIKNYGLDGGPGQDDSGAMSSWYIFSALGFFPNAGQDIYYLNGPLYPKSDIILGNGKILTLKAKNAGEKNIYIKSCKINGKVWNSPIFHHSDIANGGVIEMELSDVAGDWGKD